MKKEEAIALLREIKHPLDHPGQCWPIDGLCDLIVNAYDKGWTEGREDYREEQEPTEEQVWRKSR